MFTYRRRFVELGVLRAIGFSIKQMVALLAAELALLLVMGVGVGTALGRWASSLYIPYLQGTATAETRAVPFQIIFDWPKVNLIYGLLGLLFVAALIALMMFLMRLRVFQAIKLGETE
jgi:putative ABC transport system permease protein